MILLLQIASYSVKTSCVVTKEHFCYICIYMYIRIFISGQILQNYSKVSISLPAIFTFELLDIDTYIRTQKFPLHYEEQFLFNIKFWWVSSWLYIHISSSNLYITYDTYIYLHLWELGCNLQLMNLQINKKIT